MSRISELVDQQSIEEAAEALIESHGANWALEYVTIRESQCRREGHSDALDMAALWEAIAQVINHRLAN